MKKNQYGSYTSGKSSGLSNHNKSFRVDKKDEKKEEEANH